jgi:hypothetical protein
MFHESAYGGPQGVGSEAYRQEGRPYYSRSLRSAQSRTANGIYDKRVPSFVVAVTPRREFMKYPG